MNKNTHTLVSKFECCGKAMVTVIIDNKAACVMTELEYKRIIEIEHKLRKNTGLKKSA